MYIHSCLEKSEEQERERNERWERCMQVCGSLAANEFKNRSDMTMRESGWGESRWKPREDQWGQTPRRAKRVCGTEDISTAIPVSDIPVPGASVVTGTVKPWCQQVLGITLGRFCRAWGAVDSRRVPYLTVLRQILYQNQCSSQLAILSIILASRSVVFDQNRLIPPLH